MTTAAFFIVGGIDFVGLEKAEGDAEVEGVAGLVEDDGEVLHGTAGGIDDLDGEVGLCGIFRCCRRRWCGMNFCMAVHSLGWRTPVGMGLAAVVADAGVECVGGEVGIGVGDLQGTLLCGPGGGEEDVGGVVFFGEGEEGVGIEGVEGFAAGDEAGVVGGEGEAGLEVGEAFEPVVGEVVRRSRVGCHRASRRRGQRSARMRKLERPVGVRKRASLGVEDSAHWAMAARSASGPRGAVRSCCWKRRKVKREAVIHAIARRI